MTATELAPAKVNLHLHVVGRRPDGYHLLDSLVAFADAADRLSIEPSETFSLRVTGPFATGLMAEPDNLVLRAGRALAEAMGVTPKGALTLDKRLPVASGIGGGSSDAAAALRLLARVWEVQPKPDVISAICQRLGADVPVCLYRQAARMGGIGEIIDPVPALPPAGLVLVNPGVAVATPAVFKARTGAFSVAADLPDTGWADAGAMAATLRRLSNDLQAPAIGLVPVIGDVLARLQATPGCLLARMSGSGATCFGLFGSSEAAAQAARDLDQPGWWAWGGGFFSAARF